MNFVEGLNIRSILAGRRWLPNLRHSKTTGNELISRYNLKSKPKRSHVNVLSRLCEREARTLANGIHTMNSEYFPTDYVADTMKEHMQRERVAREEAKAEGDDKKKEKRRTEWR